MGFLEYAFKTIVQDLQTTLETAERVHNASDHDVKRMSNGFFNTKEKKFANIEKKRRGLDD